MSTPDFVKSVSSVTLITILYMTQIKNPTSLDFALVIVLSLYAYSIILLLKLNIDGEKLLNKGLIVDFIKSVLILSVSYFAVQAINLSNSIFSLLVSLIAISFIVFVSLKLLKFKYINLTGRE